MHERKKKDGQRKDKKMQRMRESVEQRHATAQKQPHQSDQHDIVDYKSGGPSDVNQRPGPDR